MKPRLFIGSSVEGLEVAENIKLKLDHYFDIDLWTDGVFFIGNTTLDDLLAKLDETDFAIFVFTPDDKSHIRNKELSVARDNVLYELGLYTGRLGRNNTFVIVPSHLPADFHIPSDLIGVNFGKYDSDKSNNLASAVSGFCTQLKNKIFNAKHVFTGKWNFSWEVAGSQKYPDPVTEDLLVFHYEDKIRFLHTISSTEIYIFEGTLLNSFFTGKWRNIKRQGYDGVFQMKLNGKSDEFSGLWSGWKDNGKIGSGPCSLKQCQ